jgi:hypothetical protein
MTFEELQALVRTVRSFHPDWIVRSGQSGVVNGQPRYSATITTFGQVKQGARGKEHAYPTIFFVESLKDAAQTMGIWVSYP